MGGPAHLMWTEHHLPKFSVLSQSEVNQTGNQEQCVEQCNAQSQTAQTHADKCLWMQGVNGVDVSQVFLEQPQASEAGCTFMRANILKARCDLQFVSHKQEINTS